MGDVSIVAEHMIKIEKEEHDPDGYGCSVKEEKDTEEEELEHPVAVFLPQIEVKQEESELEAEDTLVTLSERISDSSVKLEEDSIFLCGESCVVEALRKEEKAPSGGVKRALYKSWNPPPSIACFVCNKICIGGNSLRRHMQTHTKEKPYSCPICMKSYSDKRTIIMHKQIHTRQNQCSICKESFAERELLASHMKRHAGETHDCYICNESFKTKYRLIKHIRTHTKAGKYSCSVCNKEFGDKPSLAHHIPAHTRKVYKCSTCGKGYNYRTSFDKHVQSH